MELTVLPSLALNLLLLPLFSLVLEFLVCSIPASTPDLLQTE